MYQYYPKSHVKIWLSNNPNVFINLENQIRLVEMREKNPSDTIHLVYDSTLLTHAAIHKLNLFCKEHNIFPIDAHTIQEKLKSENEYKLYCFYKDEIYNLKAGGNLGVASDILRWLSPIFKWGTYTDFDFPIDTSHLPSTMITKVPLLLNIGSLKMRKKEFILANNDFVAIIDETAAQEEIDRIHVGLLAKLTQYDTDFIERTEAELNDDHFITRQLLKFLKNRSESIYIAKSKKITPPNQCNSSLKIRAYINEIMSDKLKFLDFNKITPEETHPEVIKRLRKEIQAQLNLVKYLFFNREYSLMKRSLASNENKFLAYLMKKERELYLKSIVICTTGPIQISNALFDGYVVDVDKFNNDIQPLSFNQYGLQKAFRSQNSIPLHENIFGMIKFLGVENGELNDSSWLESGKKLQASRTKLLSARQKELALSLPFSFSIIKNNIEKYILNNPKTEALKLILTCFNPKTNEFNIMQFKKILPRIQLNKKDISTEQFIQELEKLSHDAIIFNLTKEKKIKLAVF